MTTDPSQYFKGRTVQEQMTEVIGYVDTRAAEVATDAIASDVAQVHQDMLDADADASAAAASAAAAAGTLTNAVKKTGESTQNIEGDITLSTGDLGVAGDAGVQGQLSVLGGCDLRAPVTVPTPSNNTDAATKKYVDDADATKISITDINSYAVGLTGNQGNVAGIKTFVSSIVNITTGTPEVRFYDDANLTNMLAGVGIRYRTSTSTNAAIKSYAPKVNPADPSEVQRGGFLQLVANQDGTMTLNVYGTKADGSMTSKTLATFNGSSWS